MPYCEDHKIFYKIDCSSCLHEINKAGKQMDREMAKRKKLIEKANLKSKEPRAKISKVSDKMKVKNEEYSRISTQFKKENPICAIRVNEYCTGKTESVHHKRGRGKYLLEVSTFLPCCISCHSYIEAHPEEAKEKGWSESRLAKGEFVEPHAI